MRLRISILTPQKISALYFLVSTTLKSSPASSTHTLIVSPTDFKLHGFVDATGERSDTGGPANVVCDQIVCESVYQNKIGMELPLRVLERCLHVAMSAATTMIFNLVNRDGLSYLQLKVTGGVVVEHLIAVELQSTRGYFWQCQMSGGTITNDTPTVYIKLKPGPGLKKLLVIVRKLGYLGGDVLEFTAEHSNEGWEIAGHQLGVNVVVHFNSGGGLMGREEFQKWIQVSGGGAQVSGEQSELGQGGMTVRCKADSVKTMLMGMGNSFTLAVLCISEGVVVLRGVARGLFFSYALPTIYE